MTEETFTYVVVAVVSGLTGVTVGMVVAIFF